MDLIALNVEQRTGIPKVRVQIPLASTFFSWLQQCQITMKSFFPGVLRYVQAWAHLFSCETTCLCRWNFHETRFVSGYHWTSIKHSHCARHQAERSYHALYNRFQSKDVTVKHDCFLQHVKGFFHLAVIEQNELISMPSYEYPITFARNSWEWNLKFIPQTW